MAAGRLGREADDRPEEPRAPRGLLVRVALTEGLGLSSPRGSAVQFEHESGKATRPWVVDEVSNHCHRDQ